jgi:hypothetical protein
MSEDEHVIGKGYQLGLNLLLMAAPLGVAYFSDIKWVVATGFAVAFPMLNEIGGRLYDLCIRMRRTNILISEKTSN